MEQSFLSDVDQMISGLELRYAGEQDLAAPTVEWTDTCHTCHCVTK